MTAPDKQSHRRDEWRRYMNELQSPSPKFVARKPPEGYEVEIEEEQDGHRSDCTESR